MKIALCASFSFYEHVAQLEDELLAVWLAVAFVLQKPIYLLNDIPSSSPLLDEINGMEPIPLRGNINLLQSEE